MTNFNLEEARQKALKSPNIGKRGKSKKTLQREEAFKILQEYFFDAFDPIIKRQITKAKNGDHRAFKELMDRIFGKPVDRHTLVTTLNTQERPLLTKEQMILIAKRALESNGYEIIGKV